MADQKPQPKPRLGGPTKRGLARMATFVKGFSLSTEPGVNPDTVKLEWIAKFIDDSTAAQKKEFAAALAWIDFKCKSGGDCEEAHCHYRSRM